MGENSTPGPKPSVTDEEILEVFHATSDPVLSTAEVAEQVPLERRSVLNRLVSLREEGRLDSKKIGGRNSIWWLSGEESKST
jgi:DNA-binding IclR family transcriptional regulator